MKPYAEYTYIDRMGPGVIALFDQSGFNKDLYDEIVRIKARQAKICEALKEAGIKIDL